MIGYASVVYDNLEFQTKDKKCKSYKQESSLS